MTSNQQLRYAIHHAMTSADIDNLASALASCEAGRRAASKAIASGRRKLSDDVRQRKADAMREINRKKYQNITCHLSGDDV